MAKTTWEFWAVDKNGYKYHDYIHTDSSRKSKVKKMKDYF
jgi:hypothetical protein